VFFKMILNEIPLLWNNHKIALCEDILYQAYVQLQDLEDTNDIPATIKNEALTQLENIFLLNGKSLKNFPDMPIPSITSNISNNEEKLNHLIREERSYNITDLEAESQCNIPLLNNDQCAIFDAVIRAIDNEEEEYSTDSANNKNIYLYSPEFLRFLKISGLPPGEL
ncbi:16053_t:CDS:2, partial [Dentiscutata erythropus]